MFQSRRASSLLLLASLMLLVGGCRRAKEATETSSTAAEPTWFAAPETTSPLQLKVEMSPKAFSPSALTDVALALTLVNTGTAPLDVFPRAAELSARSGWVGPFWTLDLLRNGVIQHDAVREVRRWYGPPEEPPDRSHWDNAKVLLQSGGSTGHVLKACFVPRDMLDGDHLDPETLDPEGHDGIAERGLNFVGSHVLVLERSCGEVAAERRKRADFLRPGVNVFVLGNGRYELQLGYVQGPHAFYEAMSKLSARSRPVAFPVP